MEDRVDSPGLWQLEAGIGIVRGEDLKGSMAAGCEFGFRMGCFDISSFKLD